MPTLTGEKKPVVVITGISRGLGHALAEEFAERHGYLVFGCARSDCDPPFCHESICFTRANVSCDAEVQTWAKQVIDKAGAPKILINNVGIAVKKDNCKLWEISEKDFSDVIDTNVKSAGNVIRHFSKVMCDAQDGIIVNINSRWGQESFLCKPGDFPAWMLPYSASKFALDGMTRFLSNVLSDCKVRAMTAFPGLVQTDLLLEQFPDLWNHASPPKVAAEKVVGEIFQEMKTPIQNRSIQYSGPSQDQK